MFLYQSEKVFQSALCLSRTSGMRQCQVKSQENLMLHLTIVQHNTDHSSWQDGYVR